MRLTDKEIAAIKEVTRNVFGGDAYVSLFGSRTDNSIRGGDIDLYIKCNSHTSREDKYKLKIRFLVELKKIIGDQKIDLLIDRGELSKNIYDTVQREGVRL